MEKIVENDYYLISEERKAIYAFLKVVFEAPLSIKTLQYWRDNFSSDFIEVLTTSNNNLYTFFDDLKTKSLKILEEEERNIYLATFNLFNETGHILVPPWESVYVTKEQTMFGEPVFQMREQLVRYGLEVKNKYKEPEDHIAIELEFMHYLIDFTEKAEIQLDKRNYFKGVYTQYWLHKEHFNKWIKPFTMDIITSKTSDFYKGVAKLLLLFLKDDFEYIKTIKEVLDDE